MEEEKIENDSTKIKMGKVLRAHNFLRIKKKGRYVYALKKRVNKLDEPLQQVVTEKNSLFSSIR